MESFSDRLATRVDEDDADEPQEELGEDLEIIDIKFHPDTGQMAVAQKPSVLHRLCFDTASHTATPVNSIRLGNAHFLSVGFGLNQPVELGGQEIYVFFTDGTM